MFLAYSDLVKLYPNTKGIKDEFEFMTVSTDSTFHQQKGLFIPLYEDSGELKEAIQNGAVGAILEEQMEIPKYLPNQFPVFLTNNLNDALKQILSTYLEKLNGENTNMMNMTKFLFDEERRLNECLSSYDKPVLKFISKARRG
ncbi:hypothetical protein ACFSO7_05435 [Bacillus sp. CGMCC 1.16607]|uniref:hypothetical protein n=1 Tax=Bacillus sp. CGMCC 1.16607 TaxID=3351842 RepID=UPI00362BFADB